MLPDLDRHRTEPIERQGGSHEEEDEGGTAEGDESALFAIRERWADETGGLVEENRGSEGHADAKAGVHEDFPDAHEGKLLELSHVDQPFSRLAQGEGERGSFRVLGPFKRHVQQSRGLAIEDEGGDHADGEDGDDPDQRDAQVVEVFHERHLAPGLVAANEGGKHGVSPCGGGP